MNKSSKNTDKVQKTAADGPILIKKYPNRRLYNTATSSYIVLEDVIDLVKSGEPFVIEDTKTGEDITRTILNQIIFEQEIKPSNFHFPLEFQKQLISMYGDTYGKMVPNYLTESLNLFAAERSQMGEAFENVLGRNTRAMMEYSHKLAQQNMEMFRRSWSLFSGGGKSAGSKEATDSTLPGTEERRAELERIQEQIDALQERLKSLK